jgi:8-oxo-dGTP pyrophosphatase MutT (NUDIX family)
MKIFLVNTRRTGEYYLPGGGIEVGERIEWALKREVKEETGIEFLCSRENGRSNNQA